MVYVCVCVHVIGGLPGECSRLVAVAWLLCVILLAYFADDVADADGFAAATTGLVWVIGCCCCCGCGDEDGVVADDDEDDDVGGCRPPPPVLPPETVL